MHDDTASLTSDDSIFTVRVHIEASGEFVVRVLDGGTSDCCRAGAYKDIASELRSLGMSCSAYSLWQVSPFKNIRNQRAGAIGGTAAIATMTKAARVARARRGGLMLFHGHADGGDPVKARARGKILAGRRWVIRRNLVPRTSGKGTRV